MDNMYHQQISLLNSLIEICHDRYEGFKNASNKIDDNYLKRYFTKCSRKSLRFIVQLSSIIKTMGGQINKSNLLVKAYRVWVGLHYGLLHSDLQSILRMCEIAEKKTLALYEDFLQNEDIKMLNTNCLKILENQKSTISKTYLEIQELLNSIQPLVLNS